MPAYTAPTPEASIAMAPIAEVGSAVLASELVFVVPLDDVPLVPEEPFLLHCA